MIKMKITLLNEMLGDLMDDVTMEFNKLRFTNKGEYEESLFRQAVQNVFNRSEYKPKNPSGSLKLVA
jgi:uncharacterized protein (DUF2461 family)